MTKVSGNIRRAIPIDVSASNFEDENGFFLRSGAGVIKYSTFGSAKATSVSRKIATNVATVRTLLEHGLRVGESVMIEGMSPAYTGEVVVTDIPTPTSFSYALVHADETEIDDIDGVIDAVLTKTVDEQVYFVDPEIVRKVFSTGTTATNIHAGYGL